MLIRAPVTQIQRSSGRIKGLWLTVLRQRNAAYKFLAGDSKSRVGPTAIQRFLASPQLSLGRMANQRLKKAILFILAAVVLLLALLLVTQPFSLVAQFIFVMLFWGAAMLVRRVPGRFSSLLLIILSLTVSARYIYD